jgi:SAM-dependent methyltransferase
VTAAAKHEGNLDGVRHRFEWDADGFAAIYRLERSLWSRTFNRVFRKAIFQRYDITFREAGDVVGKSVLDVGCGSGIYSVDFARRGAKRVVGVDFSTNMLRIARDDEERFDVVFAMGVFDYLADPGPFLRKMATASRGKTLASFPGRSIVRGSARRLRYRLTGRGDVYFYREAEVRELAARAGFASYEIIRITSSGGGFILVGSSASAS